MATVHVNGVEIYYEVSGAGPPLTLIMGLGCSARMWQWLVPIFERDFRVITFDNRGAGRSGKPDAAYTTELFADDTMALLTALGITKTHLLGVSVGGMIAQQCALKHPDAVDRLVLGCTMPSFFALPPAPEVIQGLQESQLHPLEESAQLLLRFFLSPQFIESSPLVAQELKRIIIQDKMDQGTDAFLNQLAAAMNHDTQKDVGSIACPTMVISGEADPMVPVANARFLAERIPCSMLAVLPGVYHALWVECCEEACRRIAAFLLQPAVCSSGL